MQALSKFNFVETQIKIDLDTADLQIPPLQLAIHQSVCHPSLTKSSAAHHERSLPCRAKSASDRLFFRVKPPNAH